MIRYLASLVAALFVVLPGFTAQASASMAPAFRSDRIIVETRGTGPDVVFIPGLGSTGAAWRSTADKLDGRYRVHLVTIRGFRLTSAPTPAAPWPHPRRWRSNAISASRGSSGRP